MNKYSIYHIFSEGDFDVHIKTNYIINKENKLVAMEKAAQMEGIIANYIKPFYDKEKKDFFIETIENPYFDKACITKYTYYDRSPNSIYEEHTKEAFLITLEKEYSNYFLKGNQKLIFESSAYGIQQI